MANTWIGKTQNLELDIYNITTVLSDDIPGEQLLASLINSTSSNTTKIDEFAGNASVKPSNAIQGNLGQFDNNRNIVDSGKSISGTVGTDDGSIPTGKGVRDFVLQQQVVHTDYQGMFDYFGSQPQVGAVTATAGQTAIIYLGTKTNVTGVQKGIYNGANWTFTNVSPAENNGMWIFALELLDDSGTHFGMAIYKNDGTNPPSFDTAPFPLFKPDMEDIEFNDDGDLTLTETNADGTYGEINDKTLDYGNSFKVSQTTVDKKGRVTKVSERTMTLPNAPAIGNATITIKQGDIEKGSFTTNQSNAATITLDEALKLINTYDTIVELVGEVGDTIEIAVNTIQVPQGGLIILGQTLVADAGWDGTKSGGTIGRVLSYADAPANSVVNVKILTKTGGGGGVPIGNVTNLEIELSNQQLTITWRDPDNIIIDGVVLSVWGGTMLRYKTTPWLLADNETVGTLLVDNISRNAYQTTGFTHTGLTNGTAYYYKLFPYNEDGKFTNDIGNQISGTPTRFFENYTWQEIADIADLIAEDNLTESDVRSKWGWQVGDTKSIVGGTGGITATHTLRILGFNHDNKVGGGKAGISMELAPVCYGTATSDRIGMEATNTNANGWHGSRMATQTLPSYLNQLPADLREVIVTVLKPTATSGLNATIVNAQNDLWLLSEREVYGGSIYSYAGEGTQYAYYTTNNTATARIKQHPSGTNARWWLRSPLSGNYFCFYHTDGSISYSDANIADMIAVSFGLCIGNRPTIDRTFGNNSWQTISLGSYMIATNGWDSTQVATNLGWNIGDTKSIVGGTGGITAAHTLRILGFNHDNKVGGGKAGISLELIPCYGTAESDRIGMEATDTSSNGWHGSRMATVTLPSYLNQLPADLREVIVRVLKPTATSGTNSTIVNAQNDLWLLSEMEVSGSNTNSAAGEGTRYAYYTTNNTAEARIKQQPSGTNAVWWLRSPRASFSGAFCRCNTDGSIGVIIANTAYAVSFGLCI